METRTVNSRPLAAYHDGAVRCFLAIELSKKSWIVAVNTPLSDKIGRQTLRAGDWRGLLDLIARIRTLIVEALNRPVEVISCYEAGYDGSWLHRVLEAHGVRNYVIDPASLQVDRRARRVKTDNIDLSRLLRSLMAYLRGEPKSPFASGNAQTGHVALSSRSDRALHQQSGRARRPHDEVAPENLRRLSLGRRRRRLRAHPLVLLDRQEAGLGHHRRPDRRSDILGEIPPPVLNQVANLGSYRI